MTLAFIDGFDDSLQSQKWNQFGHAIGAGGTGRTGPKAMLMPTGNQHLSRALVDSADEHATLILGFAIKPAGATSVEMLRFQSDTWATIHVAIALSTNFEFIVRRGSGGTELGRTATNVIGALAWNYVEFKVTLSDTVGAVAIKVNGATVLNLTGLDTKNGGTKTVFEGVAFWDDFMANGIWVDDLYLCNGAGARNNDFLGDCSVETIFPTGNGAHSDFLGSDGNSVDNYQLVDETPPDATDYVGSGSVAATDTYGYGNLTHTVGSVAGVVVRSYAAKSDTGPRSLSAVVRSGGSDASGSAHVLGTGYTPWHDVFEQNPIGPADWTISSVNAAEFGVTVAA